MLYVLLVVGALLNAAAQFMLKHEMPRGQVLSLGEPLALLALFQRPLVLLGLVCYVASVVNWMVVLSRMDVSVAYPAMSIGYVLTFAGGAWLFGEAVTPTRIVGLVVILFGVFLITRPAPVDPGTTGGTATLQRSP